MAGFVLIHGGWAGGWVWEKVVPFLEANGHDVVAPDLPGHGDDTTAPDAITLDTYVERVAQLLDAQPEPAVLVGHSSGGVIITQAAEHRSERLQLLVYVCAYLPVEGQSLLDLGQADSDQLILPNLEFAPDGTTVSIKREAIHDALFADCPDSDYESFLARSRPEPLAVAGTPVSVTPRKYGGVPRAFIETQRDRGISIALQRRMHTATPCNPIVTMDTGHMPMYAAPDELAAHLSELATRATTRGA
ncbi:MAG TPA: alpha/beta fold hydrolase [Acidimicrobiia bacterium]